MCDPLLFTQAVDGLADGDLGPLQALIADTPICAGCKLSTIISDVLLTVNGVDLLNAASQASDFFAKLG